ncbi:hypothetical protein M5K25_011236 [Dendrobium thyrsiflorum]|uniref:Uncharacterized protein n=1 Tax=Dendrobium thyrsiflorum TaxID=117978 RepID=A0ABD0V9C8_DENTH
MGALEISYLSGPHSIISLSWFEMHARSKHYILYFVFTRGGLQTPVPAKTVGTVFHALLLYSAIANFCGNNRRKAEEAFGTVGSLQRVANLSGTVVESLNYFSKLWNSSIYWEISINALSGGIGLEQYHTFCLQEIPGFMQKEGFGFVYQRKRFHGVGLEETTRQEGKEKEKIDARDSSSTTADILSDPHLRPDILLHNHLTPESVGPLPKARRSAGPPPNARCSAGPPLEVRSSSGPPPDAGVSPDHHLRPDILSNHDLRPDVLSDQHLRPDVLPDQHLRPDVLPNHHLRPDARHSAGPPPDAGVPLDHHLRPEILWDDHLRHDVLLDHQLRPEVASNHHLTPGLRRTTT